MAESKKYEIQVSVATQYLPEQSDPENGRHTFAYTITIANVGSVAAQLISRHWLIADATGKVEEVRGLGVVGHQPLLQPGQSFEYTSGCVLETPVGTMRGSYQLTAEDGTQFEAPIAEFLLSMPRKLH
ncbi:Co2+/Mg2+ efflux protein ApaG [Denitratisoma sp. DHT3]|uniref:Co2+/Mg2+ efflux protein ApaG n=1 Tax=Denitratisoma sp. DHT3 TaxID=1981880 RepID=UPI0011985D90|nr:Co2+/Mg2+ efflux protein ApaG [Denitratisoma sp. DHT3]QDX81398.1 Co2+/Mg2+ efflux protein ApaG [Denitratisoma sp. DHT3]